MSTKLIFLTPHVSVSRKKMYEYIFGVNTEAVKSLGNLADGFKLLFFITTEWHGDLITGQRPNGMFEFGKLGLQST